MTALAGPKGLEEDTLREALLALETMVSLEQCGIEGKGKGSGMGQMAWLLWQTAGCKVILICYKSCTMVHLHIGAVGRRIIWCSCSLSTVGRS